MADELKTLLDKSEKVLQLIQSPVIKEMRGWESDLKNLYRSVSFIQTMLLIKLSRHHQLSHGQHWVDELKEVLCNAAELFGEVINIANKAKELNAGANFSTKVLKKASRFFSSKNHILVNYQTLQKIKSIQQKLDGFNTEQVRNELKEIMSNRNDLELGSGSLDHAQVTHSFSVAEAGGSCVQNDLEFELGIDSESDSSLSVLEDMFQKPELDSSISEVNDMFQKPETEIVSYTETISLDRTLELELGIDSESDSSLSELMNVFQKPETELVHNVSTSSVQSNMYADGLAHLGFLSASVAWEWLRGQVGDLIDSPEIKPFAQQVVDKCRYSPLIISVVGSALTEESSPFEWQLAVERLDTRRIGDRDDSLNPYIRYCYGRLKAHDLKTCFLYSALVLENQQIHISVLVKCFITEGLLGRPTKAAYKRASDIVGLLVKASLLEASHETMMVRMHSMIIDSALEILSSSTEGRQMFLGRGLGKLGDEQVDKYLIKVDAQLKEPPPLQIWEQATVIFLMDNNFSTLPSNPLCPSLVSLFLQRNRYLRAIPASFFDSMHSLTNLNLSQTRIRSLPDSLFTLKSLEVLLLRDCEHLIILPLAIGQLTALQVLDCQGTELLNLPDTISELASLKSMKVSFYGSIKNSEYDNLPRKLIGDRTISILPLEELGMFVHPGDRRWTISVSDITKEVSCLLLTALYFHFPGLESLEYFLQGSPSWNNGNVMDFNFIVGHDFKHALSIVTRDAELMHSNSERCLRFVNGETIPQGVMEVLKRATSLYLDHHFTIYSLSECGVDNMNDLRICILSDCPELQAIIHHAEGEKVILPSLEYLSLNSLWSLEAIISGHHLIAEESFNRLTFLSLRACPKLAHVFTLSMMKNLPKLEELVIEDCVSLKYIFSEDDQLGSEEFFVLPCLKVLKLYYLPHLCEIGRLSWPNVEYMNFYNCPKLKNPCMTTDDAANIKEIAADKAWWDSLEWDEPLLSERLDKLFTQIQLDDL
ncbi:disease resistance protein RPS2-like [Silene latifolia]|uniref:disease resistance protein RPS2-like n=1 Tax=Silene latifolia TaxID=37657 RepID=UPI003D78AD1B